MKVLVGSPVSKHHAYCTPQYLEAIANLSYGNFDVLLVDNSDTEDWCNEIKSKYKVPIVRHGYDRPTVKEKMVASRNYLRDYALKNGYDYLMDIDQDVIPPKDIIERLLQHKKDFVTGIYYNYFTQAGKNIKTSVAYTWFTKQEEKEILANPDLQRTNPNLYAALVNKNQDFSKLMRPINEREIAGGKLLHIRACGSGCMLVGRKALEIPFRDNYEGGFDDVLFCFDLQEKGFELFADCSVICEHLMQNKPWNWVRVNGKTEIVYK